MVEGIRNGLEIAPRSAVMESARQFADMLSKTTQFNDFLAAHFNYRKDEQSQQALRDFQKKQASLKAMLLLNAVSDEDRQELQRLQDRFYQQPAVIRYAKAQEELTAICQEIGDLISDGIGLNYGASCRTGGCCG